MPTSGESKTYHINVSQTHKNQAYCLCGLPAGELRSNTEKNPGRIFFKCGKKLDAPERCKYFKWKDELFPKEPSTPDQPAAAKTPVKDMAPQTPASKSKVNDRTPRDKNEQQADDAKRRRREMILKALTPKDESDRRAAPERSPVGAKPTPPQPPSADEHETEYIDIDAFMDVEMDASPGNTPGDRQPPTTPASSKGKAKDTFQAKVHDTDRTIHVDDDGSPRKKRRSVSPSERRVASQQRLGRKEPRPTPKSQWSSIKGDADSPFHEKASALFLAGKHSQASTTIVEGVLGNSSAPATPRTPASQPTERGSGSESVVAALYSAITYIQTLEQRQAEIDSQHEVKSTKLADADVRLTAAMQEILALVKERRELETKIRRLEERNRNLEETVEHLKTYTTGDD